MAKVESVQPGVLALQGDLLFSTVTGLRAQLETLLGKQNGSCTLDFSAVGRVDSSALSLWLSCCRFAALKNLVLHARGVPQEMQSIARLVGLEQSLS